jgi:trans-2,3-dihydro-3-hydroxyanthranilate isomerase
MAHRFETVDVFTDRRFGGNPLAVFPEAQGIDDAEMQSLAAEINLSETTFVLPPADPANTARMRIFNRAHEMPFAGHPSIGTAWVLARHGLAKDGEVRLEVPAGLVRVAVTTDADGNPSGGRLIAPQTLSLGIEVPREAIAACVGLTLDEVCVGAHQPVVASMGVEFVIAEVRPEALARCTPNLAAYRVALRPEMEGRLSLFVYARDGANIRARMFAPLAGTWEDPATGSANAALAALLLSIDGGDRAAFTVRQGVEMGRPSLLELEAWRGEAGIHSSVAGGCVPVLRGELVR